MKEKYSFQIARIPVFGLLLLLVLFVQPQRINADSGACSYHGGVNCAAGPGIYGQVICNDGWTGSSVSYASMTECVQTSIGGSGCMNLADIYAKYGLPAKLQVIQEQITQDTTFYNDCVNQAESISNLNSQAIAVLQCNSDNSSRQSQLTDLQDEYNNLEVEANAECQVEGAQQLNQLQQQLNQEYAQNVSSQCPSNSHLSGSACVCDSGYNQYGNQCYTTVNFCPLALGAGGIAYDATHCVCKTGYTYDATSKYCVLNTPAPTPVITGADASVAPETDAQATPPTLSKASSKPKVAIPIQNVVPTTSASILVATTTSTTTVTTSATPVPVTPKPSIIQRFFSWVSSFL